jgi:hypothetical protein
MAAICVPVTLVWRAARMSPADVSACPASLEDNIAGRCFELIADVCEVGGGSGQCEHASGRHVLASAYYGVPASLTSAGGRAAQPAAAAPATGHSGLQIIDCTSGGEADVDMIDCTYEHIDEDGTGNVHGLVSKPPRRLAAIRGKRKRKADTARQAEYNAGLSRDDVALLAALHKAAGGGSLQRPAVALQRVLSIDGGAWGSAGGSSGRRPVTVLVLLKLLDTRPDTQLGTAELAATDRFVEQRLLVAAALRHCASAGASAADGCERNSGAAAPLAGGDSGDSEGGGTASSATTRSRRRTDVPAATGAQSPRVRRQSCSEPRERVVSKRK